MMTTGRQTRPDLSVIVVLYKMNREAPRTLHTLSAAYQRGLESSQYEVLVVDNGSPVRRAPEEISRFGPNFHYTYVETACTSPAGAINEAVGRARADLVAICYDGARMLSPGVLSQGLRASRLRPKPVIATLGWHLGPDVQFKSISEGYDEKVEDELLSGVDWKRNAYRLFEISSLAGSNTQGWFGPLAESPVLMMKKDTFRDLGGYHTGFNVAAGGLLCLDIYREACELEGTDLVVLLGEGSFHQVHGGAFNNAAGEDLKAKHKDAAEEYRSIRGRRYEIPAQSPTYFGRIPEIAWRFVHPNSLDQCVEYLEGAEGLSLLDIRSRIGTGVPDGGEDRTGSWRAVGRRLRTLLRGPA